MLALCSAVLLLASTAAAPPPPLAITPTPQHARSLSGGDLDLRGWHIARSASVGALAMQQLLNATRGTPAASIKGLPAVDYVAMGIPSEDAALASLAAARSVAVQPAAGSEGYALHVGDGVVLVLGNSAAGVFYGAQSLLQLLGNGTTSPACRIDDWPDFPLRGAYMMGGPSLSASYLYRSGGLAWNKLLVDWMVQHKMNFGAVVMPWVGAGQDDPSCSAKNCSTHGIAGHFNMFYNAVPGFNANASDAAWIMAQLRELQEYMEERHIQFVPNMGSGTGGGPEFFDPAFAEGKWVRNASFAFDKETEVAVVVDPTNITRQLNGDFAELAPGSTLPARWDFEPASAAAAAGEWSVSTSAPPPLSGSGRSLRCDMAAVGKSQTAMSPLIAVSGGSVVQISVWSRLSGPPPPVQSQGLAQTQFVAAVTTDNNGRVLGNLSFYSWFRDDTVFDWTLGAPWSEYTAAITLPPNATHLSLHFYLRPAASAVAHARTPEEGLATAGRSAGDDNDDNDGSSSGWQIGDISVVKLDTSLRNLIRTNATDVEVWAGDGSRQYVRDRDFVVENPAEGSVAERLNVSRMNPYVVRRVLGGRIAAGARVLLSYDYLPGKVDVQGHSTVSQHATQRTQLHCLSP